MAIDFEFRDSTGDFGLKNLERVDGNVYRITDAGITVKGTPLNADTLNGFKTEIENEIKLKTYNNFSGVIALATLRVDDSGELSCDKLPGAADPLEYDASTGNLYLKIN